MKNKKYLNIGVLLHCYSGSAEMVKTFDKYDCYYAFGGAITFKNAKHNLEALKTVKSDRLLLETDCPYMTPVPYRGQRNDPSFVRITLDQMAEVRGQDVEELADALYRNALRVYGIAEEEA